MGHVISSASMSLDGYIAYADNSVGPLFEWYNLGDEAVTSASDGVTFRLTPASAEYWRAWTGRLGAQIVGRELFDFTDGWKGNHPLGVPIVVVTHEMPTDWHYPGEENFHFVTSGIEDAVALGKRIAGEKDVAVAG